MTDTITDIALAIAATGLPVFPTINKKPTWANKNLGVERGMGGYKIATTDPDRIENYFSHTRAIEIAVPMGEMSGLICIDIDVYKGGGPQEWWAEHKRLKRFKTLTHRTRSGGIHLIFKHPGPGKYPSTLAPGVDLKAAGTGYICWPGTPGYEVTRDVEPLDFPMEVLADAPTKGNGAGRVSPGPWSNHKTYPDQFFLDQIKTGEAIYPALRSLSMKWGNAGMARDKIVADLWDAANASDIKGSERWLDSTSGIPGLADSAVTKSTKGKVTRLADAIGRNAPAREPDLKVVKAKVIGVDLAKLHKMPIPPIEWLVPGVIPVEGLVGVAGDSNVGKTRWLAALVANLSAGETQAMGLPMCGGKTSTVMVMNEESQRDIYRRLKAVGRQHKYTKASASMVVMGKDAETAHYLVAEAGKEVVRNDDKIDEIVETAKAIGAKLIVFDPYVTLSVGGEENSAGSSTVINMVLREIIRRTGCAVLYAHHSPKDRTKDADSLRGDSGAYRGSSGIFGSLDIALTLSVWMPRNERRKTWKAMTLVRPALKRMIVLDSAKTREGDMLDPIHYRLVPQEMPQGDPIGVCQLATRTDFDNAATSISPENMSMANEARNAADDLAAYMKERDLTQTPFDAALLSAMKGKDWVRGLDRTRRKLELQETLGDGVKTGNVRIKIVHVEGKGRAAKWFAEMIYIENQT